MVDFSKYRPGYVVAVHCCDECARKAGVVPKLPADSGVASWLCDVCGHHAIGSLMDCEIGDWLRLHPLQPSVRRHAKTVGEVNGVVYRVVAMDAMSAEDKDCADGPEWAQCVKA